MSSAEASTELAVWAPGGATANKGERKSSSPFKAGPKTSYKKTALQRREGSSRRTSHEQKNKKKNGDGGVGCSTY